MALALNISLRLSCPLQGLLYLYLSISQLPKVWNIAEVQIPVVSVVLGHHLTLYETVKLHVATKLLLDSMLLDSAHSVVTMAAHFMHSLTD